MSKEIMFQLFQREYNHQLLERHESLISDEQAEAFSQWCSTRRSLERADVADTTWIKTCTGGYITEVIFRHDGTLNEYRLFDRFATSGCWSIKDGCLDVEIAKGENKYQLIVVGNREVNIHSAIEYKNGELHSYLKLAQVKP